VKITLSRAEKEWKPECSRDPLGCMIGFYIYIGGLRTAGARDGLFAD
jgi:hypothetical protein